MRLTRLLTPGCAVLALAIAPAAALASSGGGGLGGAPVASPATSGTATSNGATSSGGPVTGTGSSGHDGGAGFGAPTRSSSAVHPMTAGATARIIHGVAYAPALAPVAVKRAIWAGDRIRTKPYILGGGHGRWKSAGYDCSGSVSYVLHAAGLLRISEDSGQLESWGRRGLGRWITVYSNPGHAFVQIAGIRLDTSAEDDPDAPAGSGPRWRPLMTGTHGFVARHPSLY